MALYLAQTIINIDSESFIIEELFAKKIVI